ncbi:MAG: hypothetical protein C0504_05910 [Candidatus Solibacter sp.]|jgi:hypothetical protein|nr:hypothetical protein [Candidatus Solibacter sp.]HAX42385.1 hypothetical protein [Bryobacterales bacterium]
MPGMLMPLSDEMKETILDEHPQGLWIVLEEDSQRSHVPDDVPLLGHPTTVELYAPIRSFAPR